MSAVDVFDSTPSSPSPAPRNVASTLHYVRPARSKRSLNNLKKAPSSASMRQQQLRVQEEEAGSIKSEDEELSRSSSPAPSILSVGNTSQLHLPETFRGGGLDKASEALQKLMDDAYGGSFAAGLLGQKLLDQQEHMRQLMQQLEESSEQDVGNVTLTELADQVQQDIANMKQEQEELIKKLLQASNTDVGAVGISASTKAEAEAIIQSYGNGMQSSASYNSISATPTKPASSNARELRRQRNAAAPNLNKDEGLVNEIQQQLLNEVRRLQALVAERDKALAALAESLEEASRMRAMQEANIKKLETEKDAKDAHLYEAERKEAIVREENEDVIRQLKKHENEVRLLRRQLGEKTDAAESLKVTNEEMEQRLEDVLGNLATLRAKGAADQLTINGLKLQVGDFELKQRQAASKIPPSTSNLSSIMSYDHNSVDSMHGGNDAFAPDGPAGRRGGAHDEMLSPSASMDEAMVNRLRPSDAVKSLEADVAKWKSAALKYRKKWNDERRQTPGGDGNSKSAEYDDSTDEDEDIWMDEAAKTGDIRKRSTSIKRIISSASSRKSAKTMGDAFGIGRHGKVSTPWEEEDGDNTPDRSFGDDDVGSQAASSTRGSIDGFDPHFADPTIRSGAEGKTFKRRSTYTPANLAKGSPLARQLQLHEDSGDDSNVSSERPSSMIYEPGALGDELAGLQGDESVMREVEEKEQLMEQHREAMETALADMDQAHGIALAEREEAHHTIITQMKEQHESILREKESVHQTALINKDEAHSAILLQRDGAHQDVMETLQREHIQAMEKDSQSHAKVIGLLQEKHTQALANRDVQHESYIAELVQKHESKIQDLVSKQAKQHEDAMSVARDRHAETLAKAREVALAEMLAAQTEHKKLLADRENIQMAEVERLQSLHERALVQKEHDHNNHIADIETTHNLFQKNCDEDFAKTIRERDLLLEDKDTLLNVKGKEITNLKSRLSKLEIELENLRRASHNSEAKIANQSRALEEIQEQLVSEQDQRKAAESKLALLPSEDDYSRKTSMDIEEDFQDAVDTSQSIHNSSTAFVTTDGDETISAIDLTRTATNFARDTETVKTPMKEVMTEPRKEMAAQTDDEIWAKYQQSQMAAARPELIMNNVEKVLATPALGGVVVLGENVAQPANSSRNVRDSMSTFGGHRKGTSIEMESPSAPPTMYTVEDVTGNSTRPSIDSTMDAQETKEASDETSSLDRSKPPMMHVPPPPSMPPPSTLPVKSARVPVPTLVSSKGANDGFASDRPLSPDAESIKTQKNKLRIPPEVGSRPSSRVSGPPPSAYSGRNTRVDKTKPSTGGRRGSDGASLISKNSVRRQHPSMRAPSAQSFASDVTSDISRASGVSSRASDYNDGPTGQQRSMIVGPGNEQVSTDPVILNAITQTMIGEYLYKYTRKMIGRQGHSAKRHQRYFWIHPYTRTLYWTLQAPAEAVAAEANNKSAFIQDVVVVEDMNNTPAGLYHMSIMVITQAREVKITAPSKEKHDMWVTALSYLVNRDAGTPASELGPNEWRQSITRASVGAAARQRSQTSGYGSASVSKRPSLLSPARSYANMARRSEGGNDMDKTPRARGYSTGQASAIRQRRDTAAKEYLEHWETLKAFSSKPTVPVASIRNGRQSAMSFQSEATSTRVMDPRMMSAEQMLEEDQGDKSFDGLDNVRSCCDGKHDVGKLDNKLHQNRPARSRASTTSAAGSIGRVKKPKSKAEEGPLRLTSNGPPQLGQLNLNTMHTTRQSNEGRGKNSTSSNMNSNDWFTADEFGGLPMTGRATPNQTYYSASTSSSPPKAPSFSSRVSQIRTGKHQPWLR